MTRRCWRKCSCCRWGGLNYERPNTTGGWSGSTLGLSSALFTDGAGDYSLSYDYVSQTNTTARLFALIYAVNTNTGSITSVNGVAGPWNRTIPTGTVTASGDATASLLASTIDVAPGNGIALDFTYDGTSDLLIVFGGGRNRASFGNSRLDNVAINSVPEPSSIALLGLGMAGLLTRHRRKGKI